LNRSPISSAAPRNPGSTSDPHLVARWVFLGLPGWLLLTGEHLVRVPRAAMAAKLTQSVTSVEEFESRCCVLADLLNALNLPKPATLHNMKVKLGELLGAEAGRAQAAVGTLRSVVACEPVSSTRTPTRGLSRPGSISDWPPMSATGRAPGISSVWSGAGTLPSRGSGKTAAS
jgi:hypothetical protein